MDEERYLYPDREAQFSTPQRPQKKKTSFYAACPILICLLVGAVIFAIVFFGTKSCSKDEEANVIDTQHVVPTVAPGPTVKPTDSTEPDVTQNTQGSSPATSDSTEPVTEEPTEPPTEPKTPEFTSVDESYFEDALFIGDSRTDGLRLYSPFDGAAYYYKTSLSIFNVMDSSESCDGCTGIRQLLQNRSYAKIYVMFGINEAYSDKTTFLNQYQKVIDEIRSYQPGAIIYIQSIMYVTAQKMANDPGFSNDGLRAKNEGLREMANGTDIFYLEINDAVNDGKGNLPSDYTNDGVHMKPQYYSLWSDYLLAHAIVKE